jgi:Kef-type K+ transport system membrane component KefB
MRLHPELRKPLFFGVGCVLVFVVFFCATCISYFLGKANDAEIAAAFVSAPTSAALLKLSSPILETIGGHNREVAEWCILFCAGVLQWFIAGLLFSFFLLVPNKAGGGNSP